MDWKLMYESLPELLVGAVLTMELLLISGLCGVIVAIPLSIMRVQANLFYRLPISAYIYFFRSTPLLLQLFLLYYGVAQFEVVRESWAWIFLREAYVCAILIFSMHTCAYITNILRGGIESIPHGEIEAARAVGLYGWNLYRRIILPRAFRTILPAYSNEVIGMLKGTSLASTVTLMELSGIAGTLSSETFASYEFYSLVAVIYLCISFVITRIFKRVEFKANIYLRPKLV